MQRRQAGQTVAYVRVSSSDQNLTRQLDLVGSVEPDRVYDEKQSGASRDGRTALAEMIGYVREGDTVVLVSMDRLARSVVDLNQIVKELIAKGVVVSFLNEGISFRPGGSDPYAEFQLNIMASFAQLERAVAGERQADGIRAATARGAYKGRARALNAKQLAEARKLIAEGEHKAAVARRLGIDRSTLYRALTRTGQPTHSSEGTPTK